MTAWIMTLPAGFQRNLCTSLFNQHRKSLQALFATNSQCQHVRNENHMKIDNQSRDFQYLIRPLVASVLRRTVHLLGLLWVKERRRRTVESVCAPYRFVLAEVTRGLCCAFTAASMEFCLAWPVVCGQGIIAVLKVTACGARVVPHHLTVGGWGTLHSGICIVISRVAAGVQHTLTIYINVYEVTIKDSPVWGSTHGSSAQFQLLLWVAEL